MLRTGAIWLVLVLGLCSSPVNAATVQNTVTGTVDGYALDLSLATITMDVWSPMIATAAVAEISPNVVRRNSSSLGFSYDILPTLTIADNGIDRVMVTAPAGYANLAVAGVSVGGAGLTSNCPTPGAGQYCASITGQAMTVRLGSVVTTDQTRIHLDVQADAPAVIGTGFFTATVDNSAINAPMAATEGNADGDGADFNSQRVTVVDTVDPALSSVTVQPDIVVADGVAQSVIRAVLRDTSGLPAPNVSTSIGSDRGAFDSITQPTGLTGADGVATGAVSSSTVGIARLTVTNVTDGYDLLTRPVVYFTQGEVLRLTKTANRAEVEIGDAVAYRVEIMNTTAQDVVQVRLNDYLPRGFKYVKGSARINGAAIEPSGSHTLNFDIGTVPALVDGNGNGQADAGEPGYFVLTYQLMVGSNATPGDYTNTAQAVDVCERCYVSNRAEAEVTVVLDPLFDLGTIIGKVFEDIDQDGRQGADEHGIGGAMVALDDGSYVLTDEHGRYHFPAVKPGQRLLKINLQNLGIGATTTRDEARVVSVTPGLLAKANFGVTYRHDVESIGRPGVAGVEIAASRDDKPIAVMGSTEMLLAVINGQMINLPVNDIRLGVDTLQDTLNIRGGRLEKPALFRPEVSGGANVRDWRLEIRDDQDNVVRTLSGEGAMPSVLEWDGKDVQGVLARGGQIYQYHVDVEYVDGSIARSPRRVFGVNRTEVLSVNMTGSAFSAGSDRLSAPARALLAEVAKTLREFPDETVLVEGHADSKGAAAFNMELSRKRAEEAARYLIEEHGVSARQLIVRWYGEDRPIASNDLELGREINRRVEIKGQFSDQQDARLYDQFRTEPSITLDGQPLEIDPRGRFATSIMPGDKPELAFSITGRQGALVQTTLRIPRLDITAPAGELALPYGKETGEYRTRPMPGANGYRDDETLLSYRLAGITDIGNTLAIDGKAVAVDEKGRFFHDIDLRRGDNLLALMARDPDGFTRVADVRILVNDRGEDGRILLLVKPVPNLSVKLPPQGEKLNSSVVPIAGITDPGNRVIVNGEAQTVQADGRFVTTVNLPQGKSTIAVSVIDPQGFSGNVEREVEVSDERMFFLAFADGKIGQMQGSGHLEGAGMDSSSRFYTEGRVAYYLKGVIAGKYLITSAFDSGTHELKDMFSDLDSEDTRRLFANIDPDKLYPVYGDDSTLVYDAESQGKFYLALESDEIGVLVGNYTVSFSDTELAAYHRTLYGVRASYQSVSKDAAGKPDTQVVMFGAQVSQAPVHDELRATGGSLYYLSHSDIIEGSEQVILVVRDKDTGLTLSRTTLSRDVDYTIHYEFGRLLFNEPVSSVVDSNSLIDDKLLSGHPVTIMVEYESTLDSFEKNAYGTRLRKALGDNLAVGLTYINDDLEAGAYELSGVDAELRLGRALRLLGEVAQSTGVDTQIHHSDDGGLSFTDISFAGLHEGNAWKAAAELDIAAWLGWENAFRVDVYMKSLDDGFLSAGNFLDSGTQNFGAHMLYAFSSRSQLLARHDVDEVHGAAPGAAARSVKDSLQWRYQLERWAISAEYQGHDTVDAAGNAIDSSAYAAGEVRYQATDRLSASAEYQSTLSGVPNDQTTLGAQYKLSESVGIKADVSEGTQGRAAKAGAVWTFNGGRAYVDQRMTDDAAGNSSQASVVGGESDVARNTKVYSEYQIERGDSGEKLVSLLGANRFWDIDQGWRLKLAAEHSEIASGSGDSSRYAISAGVRYSGTEGLRFSNRNEMRRDSGVQDRLQLLTSNLFEMKLSPDYRLLAKYNWSRTRDLESDETEAAFNEQSLGIAYRPVASDRLNLLARYTVIDDRRPQTSTGTDMTQTDLDVISVEWSYELTSWLEWVEKEAFKRKTQEMTGYAPFTSHTWLSIHRLNFQFAPNWDLGMEYRMLTQREAQDSRQGWLSEVMWRANRHLRVGVGFNFTDFSDNEFSENDYSVYGWFFRIQGKY